MAGSAYSVSAYRNDDVVAEINVTPLVDVLLVLLIIFMVTAPVLTGQLNLSLPIPSDKPAPVAPRATLIVEQNGSFELDGRSLTASELPAALEALAAASPDTVLEVGANADADYQGFTHAISAARDSGLSNISTR